MKDQGVRPVLQDDAIWFCGTAASGTFCAVLIGNGLVLVFGLLSTGYGVIDGSFDVVGGYGECPFRVAAPATR